MKVFINAAAVTLALISPVQGNVSQSPQAKVGDKCFVTTGLMNFEGDQAGFVELQSYVGSTGMRLILHANDIAEAWKTASSSELRFSGGRWHNLSASYHEDQFTLLVAPDEKAADEVASFLEDLSGPRSITMVVKSVGQAETKISWFAKTYLGAAARWVARCREGK